jgi:hypothetical protein
MGVNPLYFLDEMEPFEMKAIINEAENVFKDNWEQSRRFTHAIYRVNSTEDLKLTDVIIFPWDEIDPETIAPERTKEERDNYALAMQNKLNNVSNGNNGTI